MVVWQGRLSLKTAQSIVTVGAVHSLPTLNRGVLESHLCNTVFGQSLSVNEAFVWRVTLSMGRQSSWKIAEGTILMRTHLATLALTWSLAAQALAQPVDRPEPPRHGPGRPAVEIRPEHRPGHVTPILPAGALSIRHGGSHYFHHGGVWYRPQGSRFVVVMPPIGLSVPVLPAVSTRVWVSGAPYYVANGVYYAPMPSLGYVVVAPPADPDQVQTITSGSANAVAAPGMGTSSSSVVVSTANYRSLPEPVIYPRNGQSPEQTEADRQECNRWATTQPAALNDAQVFQRAVAACMDARGYTVR